MSEPGWRYDGEHCHGTGNWFVYDATANCVGSGPLDALLLLLLEQPNIIRVVTPSGHAYRKASIEELYCDGPTESAPAAAMELFEAGPSDLMAATRDIARSA